MTAVGRPGVLLMTYGSPASLEREDIRAYLARVRGGREPEGELPPPTEYASANPGEDDDGYVARRIPYGVLDGPDGPGSLWKLSDAAARLLVFWNPRDEGATAVAARLCVWQDALSPVRVHLVSRTEWAEVRDLWPDLSEDLLGDPDDETRVRLQVLPFPGAVLLGTDRLLAGGPVAGIAEIEELVDAAAAELQAAAQAQ